MKKYIALALIAAGIVSMTACRHHPPRPDDDGPGMSRHDNRGGDQRGPQSGPQGGFGGQQGGPGAGGHGGR